MSLIEPPLQCSYPDINITIVFKATFKCFPAPLPDIKQQLFLNVPIGARRRAFPDTIPGMRSVLHRGDLEIRRMRKGRSGRIAGRGSQTELKTKHLGVMNDRTRVWVGVPETVRTISEIELSQ
jgi:hypothetical protein